MSAAVNCPICGPIKGVPRPCVGLREGYAHAERLELERRVQGADARLRALRATLDKPRHRTLAAALDGGGSA